GRGLLTMLVANPAAVRPVQTKAIELTAGEPSYLLFDWLTELLFAFESDKLLLCEFDVQVAGGKLTATCRGEPMDPSRHEMDHEVKAITYHGLTVEQRADRTWQADVIVDI
ncbi:MAG TPA: archease, partial [Pirellulaceae bacterium]|nr:archease [Pirellulaceae bacterium]